MSQLVTAFNFAVESGAETGFRSVASRLLPAGAWARLARF